MAPGQCQSTDGKGHSGGISLSPSEFTAVYHGTTVTVENLSECRQPASGWACQRSAPVPQLVPTKWAVPDPSGLFRRSISHLNATQGTETAPYEGRVALKWLTGQPLGFPGYSLRKWQLFYLEASPTNCPRLLCYPYTAPRHRLFFRNPREPQGQHRPGGTCSQAVAKSISCRRAGTFWLKDLCFGMLILEFLNPSHGPVFLVL